MYQLFMFKMCIHSQGVRISTFPILVLFRGYSSGANQIQATIQNGHCKRFIFKIIRYSKARGHHVRSLVNYIFIQLYYIYSGNIAYIIQHNITLIILLFSTSNVILLLSTSNVILLLSTSNVILLLRTSNSLLFQYKY